MKTNAEILEIVENHVIDNGKYKYELKEHLSDRYIREKNLEVDGHIFVTEEIFGGREGAGEEHWIVFSVENNGDKKYFKVPGFYQSYDGAELNWQYTHEVQPGEKVIRVWNKV